MSAGALLAFAALLPFAAGASPPALELPLQAAPFPAAPLPSGSRVQVTVTRLPGSSARTTGGSAEEGVPDAGLDNLSITFDWPVPVGVVALRRGDVLLFGFDRAMPADLPEQLRSVGPVLQALSRARGDNDVLAIRLPRHRAEVTGGGRRWTLRLMRTDDAGAGPAVADGKRATLGESGDGGLLVPLREPRGPATVVDPLAGDRLYLFSSRQGGQPFSDGLELLFVEVLPTLQGLAIRPLADGVVLEPREDGVQVGWTHPAMDSPQPSADGGGPPPAGRPGEPRRNVAPPPGRPSGTLGGEAPARPQRLPTWAGCPPPRIAA